MESLFSFLSIWTLVFNSYSLRLKVSVIVWFSYISIHNFDNWYFWLSIKKNYNKVDILKTLTKTNRTCNVLTLSLYISKKNVVKVDLMSSAHG